MFTLYTNVEIVIHYIGAKGDLYSMKRQFTAKPSSVTASKDSGIKAIELNETKVYDKAVDIWNNDIDEAATDRCDDIEFIYDSVDELAQDIPAILYIIYGLEDGEDYQIMNNSIMYSDTANSIWKQVEDELV